MTTDEKPTKGTQCCQRVHNGGYVRGHQCGNAAKVVRDGKAYCGRHDPVAIRARKDKRNAEWEERWEAESAARAKAEADRVERDRRAKCLDDLLASAADFVQKIEYLIDQSEGITGLCLSGDFTPWSDARYGGPLGSGMAALENLRAAIAKAKGK